MMISTTLQATAALPPATIDRVLCQGVVHVLLVVIFTPVLGHAVHQRWYVALCRHMLVAVYPGLALMLQLLLGQPMS